MDGGRGRGVDGRRWRGVDGGRDSERARGRDGEQARGRAGTCPPASIFVHTCLGPPVRILGDILIISCVAGNTCLLLGQQLLETIQMSFSSNSWVTIHETHSYRWLCRPILNFQTHGQYLV